MYKYTRHKAISDIRRISRELEDEGLTVIAEKLFKITEDLLEKAPEKEVEKWDQCHCDIKQYKDDKRCPVHHPKIKEIEPVEIRVAIGVPIYQDIELAHKINELIESLNTINGYGKIKK